MIRPLTLADAVLVAHDMRERDVWGLSALAGDHSRDQYAAMFFGTNGMAWAYFDCDRPAAIFGLDIVRNGVLEWWLLATADQRLKNGVYPLVRFGRNAVNDALRGGAVHRVQAVVLEDWPEAVRMAEAIGLRCEGRLACFGNHGEHALMMAKTREDCRQDHPDSRHASLARPDRP